MLGKISPWAYVMGCQGTSPGLTLELRPARTGGLLPTVSARWEVMCVHGPWKTPPQPLTVPQDRPGPAVGAPAQTCPWTVLAASVEPLCVA